MEEAHVKRVRGKYKVKPKSEATAKPQLPCRDCGGLPPAVKFKPGRRVCAGCDSKRRCAQKQQYRASPHGQQVNRAWRASHWQRIKELPATRLYTLYDGARRRARERGLDFTLLLDDLVLPEFCPLLGIPIFHGKGVQCDNSPSLDRVDNALGYTKDNVRVISNLANTMKCSATPELLLTFARNIPGYIGHFIS